MLKALSLNPDQTASAVTSNLDHLQAVGAEAIWMVLALEWASTGSGTWDATAIARLDEAVTQVSARGLPLILQAHGMPTWITTASGHTANPWHGPDTSGERTNWVGALHNFINRHGASKIAYVEIWNEPNLPEFWVQGISAADYMRLLQASYVDVKGTWPTIKVVGHNIARNDIGWIQDAYAWSDSIFGSGTSAANDYYHDIIGLHPYCGNSTSGYAPTDQSHADEPGSGGGDLDPNYLGYRRIATVAEVKEGAKPLAFGEFGYTTTAASWFHVVEATRAGYLSSAMNLARADDVVYFSPFTHDNSTVDTDFNFHGTTTETAFQVNGFGAVSSGTRYFDGIRRPYLEVLAGFGGSMDPGAGYIHLGVGPGLGTGLLSGPGAGTNEVDITGDVRSISLTARGAATDIDTAEPVTATIGVSNRHGYYDPTNPASPYAGQLEDGTPFRVRMTWAGAAYDLFYGELAGITLDLDTTPDTTAMFVCHDALEKLSRAYLPVTAPTRDDDTTGERIDWLADQAGHPDALRSIETGATTLGRTILGESARELMRLVELTEYGRLFVDGAGRLVFYERHHAATATRSTVVQATFADTGADTIRIPGLQLARSREGTFNRVAITRQPVPTEPPGVHGEEGPTEEPVEQVADDFASQTTKGVLAFPAEVGQLLRSDAEALAFAQYLVSRYTATHNRISQITVNALRGQWDTLLGLGPLDRVEVTRDYGPNTISVELLIQSIATEIGISPPSWSMALTTSVPPDPPDLFVVGTSQLGVDSLGW